MNYMNYIDENVKTIEEKTQLVLLYVSETMNML